jgi:hypothetical protein
VSGNWQLGKKASAQSSEGREYPRQVERHQKVYYPTRVRKARATLKA